jgi:putative ABC transport system substrate-binding protein
MRTRLASCALALALLAAPLAAQAQPTGKVYRIGWFSNDRYPPGDAAFQQGLRDLGWVEGRNVVTEYRFVQGRSEPEPALAAELISLKVDLIVAIGGRALVAKSATNTIPIVFVEWADPVQRGLVQSLARPAGNLTGLTSSGTDLIGKRYQLLKDAVPGISRVAVLVNPSRPWAYQWKREDAAAAQALGLHLQWVEVRDATEFERAFSDMARDHAEAVVVATDAMFWDHRKKIADLALKHRLPTMFENREAVEAGGLMLYGVNDPDLYRRAATYVDKILRAPSRLTCPSSSPPSSSS